MSLISTPLINILKSYSENIKLQIKDLLDNKYIISSEERIYIFKYDDEDIIRLMLDYGYPLEQNELNKYYRAIPLDCAINLKLNFKRFMHYVDIDIFNYAITNRDKLNNVLQNDKNLLSIVLQYMNNLKNSVYCLVVRKYLESMPIIGESQKN